VLASLTLHTAIDPSMYVCVWKGVGEEENDACVSAKKVRDSS